MAKKNGKNWESEQRKKTIIEQLQARGVCPKLPHSKKLSVLENLLKEVQTA